MTRPACNWSLCPLLTRASSQTEPNLTLGVLAINYITPAINFNAMNKLARQITQISVAGRFSSRHNMAREISSREGERDAQRAQDSAPLPPLAGRPTRFEPVALAPSLGNRRPMQWAPISSSWYRRVYLLLSMAGLLFIVPVLACLFVCDIKWLAHKSKARFPLSRFHRIQVKVTRLLFLKTDIET